MAKPKGHLVLATALRPPRTKLGKERAWVLGQDGTTVGVVRRAQDERGGAQDERTGGLGMVRRAHHEREIFKVLGLLGTF